MHRVSVLSGTVTVQDVYSACQGETYDILHFAGHSDEERIELSGGENLNDEDIRRLIELGSFRLLFFNSCRSARLAAFAVSHGAPYAIATTIDLPDRDAWKAALTFYEHCRAQMAQVKDAKQVDLPAAFRAAVNGDGAYMMLMSIQRQTEIGELMAQMERWRQKQDIETNAWRAGQRRIATYLALQAGAGWLVLLVMTGLLATHVWGG